jgi:glutamate-1-semialdehyde 2,1-aminomutase
MGKAKLPAEFPQFHERGDGAEVWDVNGASYIDLMCSWGPIVLGHRDPRVESAVCRQLALGDTLNGPSPRIVELAEQLGGLTRHAWSMFMKNGTDATTVAVTVARAASGRDRVLVARGSYHGSAPWCTPNRTGVTAADREEVGYFEYNDIDSVRRAVADAPRGVAAIMVTPFKHDAGFDQAMPSSEFVHGLQDLCASAGIALILDEVRTGFRLARGGSWEAFGVVPDLSAWGKALGNGYPIAAVTGTDALRQAAESIFATGSYWYSAVPMAAAIATLDSLDELRAVERMTASGTRLRAGIANIARTHNLTISQTGPVQMPYLSFDGDDDGAIRERFSVAALRAGVFLHPRHNWFLSAAHTSEVIDRVLDRLDDAFATVARDVSRSLAESR